MQQEQKSTPVDTTAAEKANLLQPCHSRMHLSRPDN